MPPQVKQKDEAGAEKTLESLVANYNTPDDWNQIMGVALTTKGMRDIDYVYMGRLMFLQMAASSSPVRRLADRIDRQQGRSLRRCGAGREGGRHRLPAA